MWGKIAVLRREQARSTPGLEQREELTSRTTALVNQVIERSVDTRYPNATHILTHPMHSTTRKPSAWEVMTQLPNRPRGEEFGSHQWLGVVDQYYLAFQPGRSALQLVLSCIASHSYISQIKSQPNSPDRNQIGNLVSPAGALINNVSCRSIFFSGKSTPFA